MSNLNAANAARAQRVANNIEELEFFQTIRLDPRDALRAINWSPASAETSLRRRGRHDLIAYIADVIWEDRKHRERAA